MATEYVGRYPWHLIVIPIRIEHVLSVKEFRVFGEKPSNFFETPCGFLIPERTDFVVVPEHIGEFFEDMPNLIDFIWIRRYTMS